MPPKISKETVFFCQKATAFFEAATVGHQHLGKVAKRSVARSCNRAVSRHDIDEIGGLMAKQHLSISAWTSCQINGNVLMINQFRVFCSELMALCEVAQFVDGNTTWTNEFTESCIASFASMWGKQRFPLHGDHLCMWGLLQVGLCPDLFAGHGGHSGLTATCRTKMGRDSNRKRWFGIRFRSQGSCVSGGGEWRDIQRFEKGMRTDGRPLERDLWVAKADVCCENPNASWLWNPESSIDFRSVEQKSTEIQLKLNQ